MHPYDVMQPSSDQGYLSRSNLHASTMWGPLGFLGIDFLGQYAFNRAVDIGSGMGGGGRNMFGTMYRAITGGELPLGMGGAGGRGSLGTNSARGRRVLWNTYARGTAQYGTRTANAWLQNQVARRHFGTVSTVPGAGGVDEVVVGSRKNVAAQRAAGSLGRARVAAGVAGLGYAAATVGRAVLSVQLGLMGFQVAQGVAEAAIDWRPRNTYKSSHEFGHIFYDPRGAYTQRQRALASIHDSQLTTRAAIGNEASFAHL